MLELLTPSVLRRSHSSHPDADPLCALPQSGGEGPKAPTPRLCEPATQTLAPHRSSSALAARTPFLASGLKHSVGACPRGHHGAVQPKAAAEGSLQALPHALPPNGAPATGRSSPGSGYQPQRLKARPRPFRSPASDLPSAPPLPRARTQVLPHLTPRACRPPSSVVASLPFHSPNFLVP